MQKDLPRCPWCGTDPQYVEYHDTEWGVPVHDDRKLFEMLILEGAQAGLSWSTILHKREGYRAAFLQFDPIKVARMTGEDCEVLRLNPGIVRNRLKIASAVTNAEAFLAVQREFGAFSTYLWAFVGDKPIVNSPGKLADIPVETPLAVSISKDLKRRGFKFVGPTIIYAYLQAVGVVNDHIKSCFLHRKTT
ncbi:MAG: DNA-3-methyladenine glycosylase I [Bacteroidetes bacterium]|nr:DNA-3-methyladenine glycosylase I [Bacteroidota bacterium]